ncbi:MAG: glycosyltransferase, partial [Pseudomonadota bacterium]
MARSFALLRQVQSWLRKEQPGTISPKRVLITQRALKNYGGSEFFAIEIARALKALGHDVALYCPAPGKLANIVTPSGIPVCETLDAVPFQPDIIHGQHHLPTMAALAYFPGAPAIYCWHGARPWVEQPPVHPRIRFHVVTSARMGPRLTAEFGIPAEHVLTIPNFVDLQRFSRIRTLKGVPKRAVLYGQYGFNDHEVAQLEQSCQDNGLQLDKVGPAYG